MKRLHLLLLVGLTASALLFFGFRNGTHEVMKRKRTPFVPPKGCVYRTLMGEESSNGFDQHKTPERVLRSMESGLGWLVRAQHADGGWGAGTHARQDIYDPHAVAADPATTAMVSMALMRSGTTLREGSYTMPLRKAILYLLQETENADRQALNITTLQGTQIQTKLGANIDVILTAQCLANALDLVTDGDPLKRRLSAALDICVDKIQRAQDGRGHITGAGWAGVLQSSLAVNALESAQSSGASVDEEALTRSRDAQKSNYNPKTGDVNTDMGAGVMLYSITGSVRGSAKEARKVEEALQKAKREGKLSQNAPATAENLGKIGFDKDDAMKYATAYAVYQSAKVEAQREDVMDGFGSNGGEEFLSYLQTGESLIISKDDTWQSWYDNMSGRILKIQNDDGSWSGHHCITSPVFCTATSLLILGIDNDIEKLTRLGSD